MNEEQRQLIARYGARVSHTAVMASREAATLKDRMQALEGVSYLADEVYRSAQYWSGSERVNKLFSLQTELKNAEAWHGPDSDITALLSVLVPRVRDLFQAIVEAEDNAE